MRRKPKVFRGEKPILRDLLEHRSAHFVDTGRNPTFTAPAARYREAFTPPEKGDRLPLDEQTEALYHFEPASGDEPFRVRDASPNNQHGSIMEARWAPFR